MKKITLKIFFLTTLLIILSAAIGNICLAASSATDSGLTDFSPNSAPLGNESIAPTVAKIVNAGLGLLGILCVIGIFVCVPLGIYFLTKKELVSGGVGEKQLIDIGEILKRGWNLFKNNYQQFITPLIILLAGNLLLIIPISIIAWFNINAVDYANIARWQFITAGITIAIIYLADIFISLWISIVITKIIASLYLEQPLEMKKIHIESFHKVPSFFWVCILLGLTIFGGFILLIIPALIFSIWFTFATYANILNGYKGVAAMKASYYLVKGRWLDTFIRIFVFGLVIGLASIVLMIITAIISGILTILIGDNMVLTIIDNVFSSILSLILTPLTVAFSVILYYSMIETRPFMQAAQPTQSAAPIQPAAPIQ